MIRINQVKLKVGHLEQDLIEKVSKILRIASNEIISYAICKQSIDARKKPDLYYSYVVDVEIKKEETIVKRSKSNQVTLITPVLYQFPDSGEKKLKKRPVIIGMGPAGLFCGYFLAKHGYAPLILERGEEVEKRQQSVDEFWKTGVLNFESNVQFGEGGAGTFSDGKLNTLVKDKSGRNKEVLKILVECGAPEKILYEQKPHIGTDILIEVVKAMRKRIQDWGGEVRFQSLVQNITIPENKEPILTLSGGEVLKAPLAVLAIGHSARDTFEMLYQQNVPMEAKSFAVGLRVEHPQTVINTSQYGFEEPGDDLGPAPYKVTANTLSGRGVYSFCMCPGGFVVDASSEPGRLAVNGMSYSKRDGANANSAIIVSVSPLDFPSTHPLAGISFQRNLEERAYQIGKGKIPVETYLEFVEHQEEFEETFGTFQPQIKGQFAHADVRSIMPETLNLAFMEGMETFESIIPGFAGSQVLVSGIESRTSSPVRIVRDELGKSNGNYLYPCGEGAGYAGGITSAAMDGMKIAEEIAKEFQPFQGEILD